MTPFKGGYSKVEFDDAVGFASATEIPGIMKSTKVTPSTPTEDLANGGAAGQGKQYDVEIDSEDLTAATYTELIAAEAAQTPMFFRFTGIKAAQNFIIKSAIPIVQFHPAEAGKAAFRKVIARGFADTEANVLSITP